MRNVEAVILPDALAEILLGDRISAEIRLHLRLATELMGCSALSFLEPRIVNSTVSQRKCLARLIADGAGIFVELGPGTVLAGLIRKIDASVATMSVENSQGLEKAIASLASGRR